MLGGIIPVPVALGISDEHRHKLLRIARKLGNPFLYTDRRSLERIGSFATQVGETRPSRSSSPACSWWISWMTSPAPASRTRGPG